MPSSLGYRPKKRKRSTTPGRNIRIKEEKASTSISPSPPTNILLIDNGGDTLKFGVVGHHKKPESIPNITARLRHQLTVLIGDEVHSVQPTQLISITKSLERGCITNFGNQVQVWKRLLEKVGVQVPLTTEASETYCWKVSRQPGSRKETLYSSHSLAVVIMLCPLCPRSIMDQVIHVWFHDFGFSHVGLLTTAAFGTSETSTECCCVVDMGWSASQIVPTYKHKILGPIRRHALGTRHLVGLWKYYCSYRQWNLMDSEYLLEEAHRLLSYVSLDLKVDLEHARRNVKGKRPFDREFVLPDYQTTLKGFVRLTPWLKLLEDKMKEKDGTYTLKQNLPNLNAGKKRKESLEKDEEVKEDSIINPNEKVLNKNSDNWEDSDSADETEEQCRKRLLILKEEADERNREIEAERQTLLVSLERFTIPEVLFFPSDAGFDIKMSGLHQVIASAIEACPFMYRSALYGSIRLIGGASQLSNLKERIYLELRQLIPFEYKLKIEVASDPINDAWINASCWLQQHAFFQWSISREQYEMLFRSTKGRPRACQKLLEKQHGKLI